MKNKTKVALLLAGATLLGGAVDQSWAASSIGAHFLGRNFPTHLAPSEVAGVVPQPYWNEVDGNAVDFNNTFIPNTSLPFLDSAGNATAVQLVYDCNDSWGSDGPTVTPDDRLMKGIIKCNPNPDTAQDNTARMLFVATNLPTAGTYNVFVYLIENGVGAEAECTIAGATTFDFLVEQTNVFQGYLPVPVNTTSVYLDGNYAEATAIAPAADGTITITVTKNVVTPQINDGAGVAAIQIVQVSGPAFPPNTATCSITNNPSSATNIAGVTASFSVGTSGPHKTQWQRNNANIAGANDDTYTTPILALSNTGDQYVAVVYNNLITNTSAAATSYVYANTNGVAITADPASTLVVAGSTATFSVGHSGPLAQVQWQSNTVNIANATNDTYTTTVTTTANNGDLYRAVVNNNVNSVTSAAATLYVDANVAPSLTQGYLKADRWENIGNGTGLVGIDDLRAAILGGPPTTSFFVVGPDVPQSNPNISNFGVRVSGWVKPDVTGDYDFFTRSDDPSQVFLNQTGSTTPGPLPDYSDVLNAICEEDGCCNPFTEPPSPRATAAPIHLIAGNYYGFVALQKEGGGGDFVQVAWRNTTDTTPAASLHPIGARSCFTMASPAGQRAFIISNPQSVSKQVGQTATFNVGVSNFPAGPLGVVWLTNGTIVPGVSGTTYITPVLALADNGTQVKARAFTLAGPIDSTVALLTVTSDTTPPTLLGASAFPGSTKVGVKFDEALDPVTAGDASKNQVNGGAVISVQIRTNVANELTSEQNLVELTVGTPLNAAFQVMATGVKDVFGNAMPQTTVAGSLIQLTLTDIGSPDGQPGGPDPNFPSSIRTWGPGNYDVLTGGNDYYNNADGISFAWVPKTNSFDVKVRVVSVQNVNPWSAGAIMVREGPVTPTGGGWELARHYFCKVDYSGADTTLDGATPANGANTYEFNARLAPGDPTLRETSNNAPGGSVGWGGTGPGNPSPVPYPNAWIRIARVKNGSSDHMLGYSSNDGLNWSLRSDVDLNDATHAGFLNLAGAPAGPLPDVMYVGLASTAHDNNLNPNDPSGGYYSCWVIYRDYAEVIPTGPPSLSVVANANGSVTFTYTGTLVSAGSLAGPWNPVSGASSPYTVTNPKATPNTFFRAQQ